MAGSRQPRNRPALRLCIENIRLGDIRGGVSRERSTGDRALDRAAHGRNQVVAADAKRACEDTVGRQLVEPDRSWHAFLLAREPDEAQRQAQLGSI